MGLFSRVLKKDPLNEQAKKLVPAVNILAISSFVPLLDKHPFLREIKPEVWDFYSTAGAIFVAINNLKGAVPPERFMNIYGVLLPYIRRWHERGEEAVLDCQQFVLGTVASGTSPPNALGLWILWNVLERQPSESEVPLSGTIGSFLSTPLQDWWRE